MQNSHNGKNHKDSISGAILAGGKSQRMQSDKATLRLAGETLFSRGVRTLATVCSDILIAGERSDLSTPAIPCYADIFPGSSLGGLHTAIQHAANDWVCVLPCDLPFPSPRLLKRLLQYREGQDAIIPRTSHGSEPLIACYHKRILPIIEQQIAAGNLRLTNLLDRLNVRFLDPDDLPNGWRRALSNLNTPADLDRLNNAPAVLTFVAHSGTGKTTLVEKIINDLTRRGWTVGGLKHDAHRFEIDQPGKDSWRLTQAGAAITAISSDEKSAVIYQHELPPTLDQVLAPFNGQVDIVITEGFKQSPLPKIEVFRKELGRQLICRGERHDPTLIAFASNAELDQDVPVFPLDNSTALSDFIEETFLK
jgi:molybdopterin-guanine dinucleotide biosynthesis protein B/molybdopterin-guanine dinucleotide biosynthesis protein